MSDQSYDYVIVGGGSAGCVLAARLSERSNNRVCLLEAGEDYTPGNEPPEVLSSFAGTAHSNPRFTWSGLTCRFGPRPSNAPDERKRPRYTQGRVIGGGSSVNGMISIRGVPSDYDDWAAKGATGWNWDGVLPFFRKLETDTDFDGPMHGKDGPVPLRRIFADKWPGYTTAVMEAVKDKGFKYHADQNATFEDGYYPLAICNMNDQRVSAAIAYLTREVRARPNLIILGGVHAERLAIDGARITGIHVRRHGRAETIAAKEVIVCTGAIHSPALLMRSGIGPGAHLREHGIEIVADRPGVGQHLMEHPGVNIGAYMKRDARLPPGMRRQMLAGMRFSSNHPDCATQDMYLVPTNKAAWHAIGTRLGLVMIWVNRSYSTGEVRLNSPDAFVEPAVDFNMCSDARDLARLVAATRMTIGLHAHPAIRAAVHEIFPVSYSDRARKIAVASTWNRIQTAVGAAVMDTSSLARKAIIKTLIADGPSLEELMTDDEAVIGWVRQTVLGHWHASCTCRMGAESDPGAVTDPVGRVYGVDGLRVCDASIMPMVPSANTNIPTIMVGEKIAAAVLEGR
jgi:5-(hydroxymethyl)furfural/furfural oxidase